MEASFLRIIIQGIFFFFLARLEDMKRGAISFCSGGAKLKSRKKMAKRLLYWKLGAIGLEAGRRAGHSFCVPIYNQPTMYSVYPHSRLLSFFSYHHRFNGERNLLQGKSCIASVWLLLRKAETGHTMNRREEKLHL